MTDRSLTDLRKLAAEIVLSIGTLTALLAYFGLAYTSSEYWQFGVDASVLDLSPRDLATRSVAVPSRSLLAALAVAVGVGAIAYVVDQALNRVRGQRRAIVTSTLVAVAAVVGDIAARPASRLHGSLLAPPLLRIAAVTLLAIAWIHLCRAIDNRRPSPAPTPSGRNPTPARTTPARRIVPVAGASMLALLAAYAAFDLVRVQAHELGEQAAYRIERHPTEMPLVVVVTNEPLGFADDSVTRTIVDGRHRYCWFRYLTTAGGYHVVWPAARSPRGGVMLLAQSDIRLELTRSGTEQAKRLCPIPPP